MKIANKSSTILITQRQQKIKTQMDFFKDFGDVSSTPIYSKYTQQSNQKNKNIKFSTNTHKKDDFDDLLSDLMSKEDMKKNRKHIQPYSSQNLGIPAHDPFVKTTQKFYNGNTQSDFNLNFGLSKQGNKGSKKSILDDMMSQDNKSIRSGATGRRDNQPTESINYMKSFQPALTNQVSQPNISVRAGMRPPLKKKGQSREPSIFNDDNKSVSRMNDNMGSIQDLEIISNTPKMPRRQNNQNDRIQETEFGIKLDLSASKQKPPQPFRPFEPEKTNSLITPHPVIQQKIIQKVTYIKQDNKQLTQRHHEQIRLMKESYQRQINSLKDNYEKIIKDEQQNRKILVKTYEESIDMEKRKWQKMIKDEGDRIKQLYEWEQKKKTQSYELQVKKLKQLLQTITKNNVQPTNHQQSYSLQQQASLELTTKIKELQFQRQRIEQQKLLVQTKRRQLQSEEQDFDLYKRRQENKLNDERKKLFQYETQVRKRQVQMKKAILSEKQSLASELVNTQMTLAQARQNTRHQNEKLNMEKELFAQQRVQYQKINNKILADFKQRQRNLQTQKQQAHQLQVELYKKINTIELMAVEKGLSSTKPNPSLNQTKRRPQTAHRSVSFYDQPSHKQNNRNRINSQLDNKIAETKGRYQQMEQIARSNSINRQTHKEDGQKIHLQKYIQKLTTDRLKLVKY